MSTKTRLWIMATGIVCAVVLLLGAMGGLLPQLNAAFSTLEIANSTNEQTETQRTAVGALEAAKPRLNELEEELDDLRRAIPDSAASAAFLLELQELEERTGAVVSRFVIEGTVTSGEDSAAGGEDSSGGIPSGVTVVPVVIEISGEESATSEFVRGLQLGERLLQVDQLEQTENMVRIIGSLYVMLPAG